MTANLRRKRASEIARALNDTDRWHSHGRGISMEVLRRELNLLIEDFGEKPDLSAELRVYYKLLDDYMARRDQKAVLHTPGRYTPLMEG